LNEIVNNYQEWKDREINIFARCSFLHRNLWRCQIALKDILESRPHLIAHGETEDILKGISSYLELGSRLIVIGRNAESNYLFEYWAIESD
jgi:hypothetical protein